MKISGPELDRYITGNYGEDQFEDDIPRKPRPYVEKPPVNAEIIEITTFSGRPAINVKTETGQILQNLTAFCIVGGYSNRLRVGTKGMAQYRSSSSYGLWFFKPEVL